MSKLLQAMLFPFLHTFKFGDGEISNEVIQTPATEPIAALITTETPTEVVENQEVVAPKTFTEAELKAQVDAEAAKIRNKYERKIEKQRIEAEVRAKVAAEQAQQPVETGKPIPENYADYATYLEDLADFKAEEKFNALTQRQKDAESNAKQQTEVERQTELKHELINAGESKYADFEEVVNGSKAEISNAAWFAILETSNSADILYHLAKNDEEAKKFAALSPYAQAKEIGKLEDRLSAKPPLKTSNAPEPIKPIEGGHNLTKKLEDMTYEEMLEHDRKRGARYLN
jgi:hypothetical protein